VFTETETAGVVVWAQTEHTILDPDLNPQISSFNELALPG